ncbi:MAG: DUF423 domain-containing protein [Planctomycetota bacterium]|nr:DUF423 domain-containing protein [Planctomycetota bacterium]MDA0934784.1 DUF423 domain-containing protein [Planctomycetota bacterium]
MTPERIFQSGALVAGLAVALGAFGAHGLEALLDERGTADTFEIAVRYQFFHALALLACAWRASLGERGAEKAAQAFLAGTAVFSGTLYFLAVTGPRWLGAVTPIGGVLLIAGWILLARGVGRSADEG